MSAGERSEDRLSIPSRLPLLPLRDLVVFPMIISPLSIARETSIQAVDRALANHRMILLTAQRDKDFESPGEEDLHSVGTVAVIMRMLKLPDGRIRVLVQGVCRARLQALEDSGTHLEARIEPLEDEPWDDTSVEAEAMLRSTKQLIERASGLGKNLPSEVQVIAENLEDPGRLADLCASNLELKLEEAQLVLETLDPIERLRRVHDGVKREVELLSMQREIDSLARDEMDRSQREFYLRQQLKAIQAELGEGDDLGEELEQYRAKAREIEMPEEAAEELERQVRRLERMHPESSEAATLRSYLDWLTGIPWGTQTKDNLDLRKARGILDEDHYGLNEIKDRILEHLAVRKLNRQSRGPILCFVGPPGVGKTSLGRSIARALGRKFVRLSLGGVRDEAEIRGHRRTYVGAMPGRIIQGMQQAGSVNPLFMFDEVDKIGGDHRGDPSAALLEVLDPEQNSAFRDHYLGVPYDLSKVMFITTANRLDTIQPAFLDRMELIRLAGYTEEEKLAIARRHLVPRKIEDAGLDADQIEFSMNALRQLIREYTREAGLRGLDRKLARVSRKVARRVAEGRRTKVRIIHSSLEGYLGPAPVSARDLREEDQIGVVTGLAWTESGGDVLSIEATTMDGKGQLMLTGQLGDVMKESAQAALSFARSKADSLGIPARYFETRDVHVHVPEGAIPKDGPSAGITMATAMLSAFTGRPVRRTVAMTGEITLRGAVLPVGGIKEKLLAALRYGYREIVIPEANRKNLEEIPKPQRKELTVRLVKDVREVFELTLANPRSSRGSVSRRPAAHDGLESSH